MFSLRRAAAAIVALLTGACLMLVSGPAGAASRPAPIAKSAFSMHFLGYNSRSYPGLSFASARIWDMGVSWSDLQPSANQWNGAALSRLDSIVSFFHSHHVEPILVFGWTPQWAADGCRHTHNGKDYGVRTCAPSNLSTKGPWASYVRTLVTRYDGRHGHPKVTYFETWNEGDLPYGWMDSIKKLATLQNSTFQIIHGHHQGQKVLSASMAISYGYAPVSLNWFNSFLAAPGGRSFDIMNVHLYPTVQNAKANIGPEWGIQRLASIRAVMAKRHVSKPVWNTEMNIGSGPGHVTFGGTAGAAQVDRALVLGTSYHVARTYWYAADDRGWGGVWLENSDYRTLTSAGKAYHFLATTLVGARPYGCSVRTVGRNKWNYTCKYHLRNGKNMFVLWTTGSSYHYHGPRGTQYRYTAVGTRAHTSHATRLTINHTPLFVVGTFKI